MKKIILLLSFLLTLTFTVPAQQERLKMHYVEFKIPYSLKDKKATETMTRIEQKRLISIADFRNYIETGVRAKLIKIVDQGVMEVVLGQNNLIVQTPDVVLRDGGGNVIEKRPAHIFSVAPWILGEENNSYISFDLIFERNRLDPVQAQNHDSWSHLDLSATETKVAFNTVMHAGGRDDPWDDRKSKYHGLGIYFEK